ncbi:MAG TPA: MFS transporter [Candidatus Baltobacteraceae bacterium]|nr:MFS transporter [Candidatus Baltobacteraceae bacterium]
MMNMSADTRKMVGALIPIYGITLIDCFGYMIMVPLLPYLAQKFGASGVEVGALLATMAIASTVAAPFWGAISDRVGRKPIVLVSQVISLIGYLALAWAPTLPMLFVSRGVAGIGGGNLGVTQSYIADVTKPEYRDRAYAVFGAMFGTGIVLGPVTGGFLVRFGYWVPFVVAAIIEVLNIGLTIRFLPKTKRKRDEGRFNLAQAAKVVVSQPGIRSLILRHFLFIFAVTYFFSVFALYVKRALDFGPQEASWLMAGTGVVGGVMLVIAVGPLAKRIGDAAVAQIGLALNAIAYGALGFAHNLWFFVAVLVVWGIGAACIEPTIAALLSKGSPADKRGATLGFNDSMSNLALMSAPALGGWVIDRNVGLIGVIPGAAIAIAFALGWWRRADDARTDRSPRTQAAPAR